MHQYANQKLIKLQKNIIKKSFSVNLSRNLKIISKSFLYRIKYYRYHKKSAKECFSLNFLSQKNMNTSQLRFLQTETNVSCQKSIITRLVLSQTNRLKIVRRKESKKFFIVKYAILTFARTITIRYFLMCTNQALIHQIFSRVQS